MRNLSEKNARTVFLLAVFSLSLICGCGTDGNSTIRDNGGKDAAMEENVVNTGAAMPNEGVSKDREPSTSPSPSALASAPPSAPASAPAVELPEPQTKYITGEMLKEAVLAEGNLTRLAAVMRKARSGGEITVGVIGGSITQGSLASSPQNSYAYRFYQWWTAAFPDAKVNFVNAGIGATTSYLGVHRVDKDLLSKKPDVVVVEFSVNDSDTPFFKQTYEDMLRKILSSDNNPAVILLFMTMETGVSAQPSHLHVGFWYDLPRISYREMILKEIKKGTFTWKDISPDDIHPNDKGHAIVGEILWGYLNTVYARLDTITDEAAPLDKEPIFDGAYTDAIILDNTGITPVSAGSFAEGSVFERYRNGWTTESGEESIVFEVEARNIGIIFYRTTDGKSGQFEVLVDGELRRTLDGDFTGGWGNYAESVEVYRSGAKEKHRVEIRKASDSTGGAFAVLGLLIS